ncbi:TRAM domain-containing protein [Suttonella ornithocola]|uniref:23S rRNA (Uracil(1939)-C(5))-methyltransferase RlmD n=1 Tax=Suttonella ornithocola TaxID=279832 RepID=A0A380MMQ0_9GAMM|nr:TRAM domain-containing protein [Suttonella ornithocola]SUO93528.1 23S rRNA (uracil(1939)-C(5))-methyltransferase RlmD [Suttonella ornithocola]
MTAVTISALDFRGRGIARLDGQVIFIEGALPGETVTFREINKKKRFVEASVNRIIDASEYRTEPACPYYEKCGGCALQHVEADEEVVLKIELWKEQLRRIGKVEEQNLLSPIVGDAWRYRVRSRLAVSYEGDIISVGFRARRSHDVIDIKDCLILAYPLAAALPSLSDLLAKLLPLKVTALSLHKGEQTCALAIACDKNLPLEILKDWVLSQKENWQVWVNHQCIIGEEKDLFYDLAEFDVRVNFTPDDFTQVNPTVNHQLVSQAVEWIQPQKEKEIVDFFAGLGNFSLPFARLGAKVYSLEGVQEMVKRGELIAQKNHLKHLIETARVDLFAISGKAIKVWQTKEVWFVDPPRAGAQALMQTLVKSKKPSKIVYVSCDSATLARDAKLLNNAGFQLKSARVANMFARSAHIESISLFER